MKIARAARLGVIVLLAWPAPGLAASFTVTDNAPALAGIASTMAELLVEAGLPLRKTGDDSYTIEVKNLHCDYYSNQALDASNPFAGLPAGQCRYDAENTKDTKTGKPFSETHALTDLLSAVQNASAGRVALTDCAMGGYCGAFAKSVRCVVNTSVKTFDAGGRWICVFQDGR